MNAPAQQRPKLDDKLFDLVVSPSTPAMRTLRIRVLSRLLLVALVPVIAVSVYLRYQFTSVLEQRSKAQLETFASTHGDFIDRYLSGRAAALESVVQHELVLLPPGAEEMTRLLNVMQSFDSAITDVGVFDQQGTHVRYAGPHPFLEGKSYAGEKWFQQLSTSDQAVFISDNFMGYRNQPHFVIAIRVLQRNVPWYVRLTILPAKFNELVGNVRQIEGAQAFIINRDGVFQCASAAIGVPLTVAPNHEQLAGSAGVLEMRENGKGYLVATHPLRQAPWTLVVRQRLDVAYAPVRQAEGVVLLILALGVGFIIVASLLATQTLLMRYRRVERSRLQLSEQLVQAGKMGTMGEMAAGIAHEINNPLAIILSETGLMRDAFDPSLSQGFDQEEFIARLGSIEEEARRCRTIIHKLLGFARRTSTSIESADLNDIAEHTVDLIARELGLENIEVVKQFDASLPTVETDAEKITQVVLNLLRNAADAIVKNGRITVKTDYDEQEVRLSVTDTGSGIAPENLEKIFHPFFTTKEVGKGTGLGLSISHGIIASLGGSIEVSSELGRGSLFTIVLPRKRQQKA